MSIFSLLAALFFASVALAIIGIFLKAVLETFAGDPKQWLLSWKIGRKERSLGAADAQLRSGGQERAREGLRRAFYLETFDGSGEMIDRIHSHHLEILARV